MAQAKLLSGSSFTLRWTPTTNAIQVRSSYVKLLLLTALTRLAVAKRLSREYDAYIIDSHSRRQDRGRRGAKSLQSESRKGELRPHLRVS